MDKTLALKQEYYYHNFGKHHLLHHHMNNKYFQYDYIVLHKKDILRQVSIKSQISDALAGRANCCNAYSASSR